MKQKKAFDLKKWGECDISLYKLNGGFEVCKDDESHYIDYTSGLGSNIILPSQEQNYGDAYFKNCFIKSSSLLRSANTLVFVGYSLPSEDHTIRFLLKNFTDCKHLQNKDIFVVSRDVDGAKDILVNVKNLFPNLAKIDNAILALDGGFSDLVAQS